MKNERILKEEMREVKGGFNPEFTVSKAPDDGKNVYFRTSCSDPIYLYTITGCSEPTPY
jgi:hypothetical protein